MESWKRNQMEEAISVMMGQGSRPSASLQTTLKRVLETDRDWGRKPQSKKPELANYAFYSDQPPGRGADVWFSNYEVFALLKAAILVQHGWSQGKAVSILRRARPALEAKHREILKLDPTELFDEKKIREAAKEGSLAVWSTRPVYLSIVSSTKDQSSDETMEVAVLEQSELVRLANRAPGTLMTMIELTRTAHDLQTVLRKTKPTKRGRGSS